MMNLLLTMLACAPLEFGDTGYTMELRGVSGYEAVSMSGDRADHTKPVLSFTIGPGAYFTSFSECADLDDQESCVPAEHHVWPMDDDGYLEGWLLPSTDSLYRHYYVIDWIESL